jgi:hypothetical protein
MTTPTTVQVKLQLRADTAANWSSVNPVLLNNELALETDTKKLKVGNGSTAWNSLAYFPFVVSGGTVTGNLEIGTTGTLTFEGSSADNFETTLGVVNPTADRTINLPNVSGTIITTGDTGTVTSTMIADGTIVNGDISASAEIAVSKLADGAARQLLQTDAAGTGVEWTDNVDVPGTLDVTGAATFDSAVTIAGDLTVNGTTTNINTQNLVVEDKNIILADVTTPTDTTADGGGITLKGATDKTITWSDTTDAWTSNQVVDLPAGSAATPSLIFGADVNSGVYSPGADQVAISTNGTGRLFVDSTGKVEVSKATGSATLSPTEFFISSTTDANDWNTTNPWARLAFYSADTTNGARTRVAIDAVQQFSNGNVSALSFKTDNGSGTLVERQRISYTGITTLTSAASTEPLIVKIDTSEVARIDSSGRLGLGTSNPQSILHLAATGDPKLLIEATGTATSDDAQLVLKTTNGEFLIQNDRSLGTSGVLTFNGNTTDNLCIDHATGRVGIGTTSPGSALEVSSASNTGVTIRSGSITDNGFINFTDGAVKGQILYDHNGDYMRFYTNGGEAARIDSSGRLLVGTSSSVSVASLEANQQIFGSAPQLSIIRGSNNASGATLALAKSRNTAIGSRTIVSEGDTMGSIRFCGDDGVNLDAIGAQIAGQVDGTPGAGDLPSRLVFSTTADGASSPTERMRISSAGNVMVSSTDADPAINGTASAISLRDDGRISARGLDNFPTMSLARGGTDGAVVRFYKTTTDVGNISLTTTATAYNTSSDYRLKENISPLAGAADRVKQLTPCRFNFIADPDKTVDGFIAHEAQAVVPECVTGTKDEVDDDGNPVYQGIDQSKLVPLLTAALQEALAEIESLKARLTAAGI